MEKQDFTFNNKKILEAIQDLDSQYSGLSFHLMTPTKAAVYVVAGLIDTLLRDGIIAPGPNAND